MDDINKSDVGLSPPWYILRDELYYTVGASDYVNVSELQEVKDGFEVILSVKCNKYKNCSICKSECCNEHDTIKINKSAQCLRNIIPYMYEFGNIKIFTRIYDSCNNKFIPYEEQVYKNVEEVANEFCCALSDNPYFKGVILVPEGFPSTLGSLVVIIDKQVIQFYDDNISDICQNYNQVAAVTFSNVLKTKFLNNFIATMSTYDHKCIKCSDLYCR
ncbi:hypothetical protein [Romboutsia sp.]|uniref:hypothetical protein n=1 Tax=Romboutsia sp. TaxID=1965302 RepID=UPI003F2B1261